MAQETIEKQLQMLFPKSTVDDWKKIAMQETGGKDPFEVLSWQGKDNLSFFPYYDSKQAAPLRYLDEVLSAAGSAQTTRRWLNIPAIAVKADDAANVLALEHLSHGADGVLLDLSNSHHTDFKVLTAQIALDSFTVLFQGLKSEHVDALAQHVTDTRSNLKAALFWDSVPKISNHACAPFLQKKIRPGITIKPSTPAQEVADALFAGVSFAESVDDSNFADAVTRSIAFSLPADSAFLETAGKMKALRLLWAQVVYAYGHNDYKPADLHLHARSMEFRDQRYEPQSNMLSATFASMAAILGGCDSLTIQGDLNSSLFRSWSVNVSHILREESFFGALPDALSGAFAGDAITDAIAEKAWRLFQAKLNKP